MLWNKWNKKKASMPDDKPIVSYTLGILRGEVIDITTDEKSGLSCIVVRDEKGMTQYGYSDRSVKDLEQLYVGNGFVEIPIRGKKIMAPNPYKM